MLSPIDHLVLQFYVDWARCPHTYRPTSSFCVYLCNILFSWSSKRQHVVSCSLAETECRRVENVVVEAAWLHNLLLKLYFPLTNATVMYCDNVNAMYLYSNPVQHQCTKHVEINLHFVRECVAIGLVLVVHVPPAH